ncbi:O-antigen ligase family protein [Bradyrhizobium guangzhouense]|uniref:O-antigen ligase family protein n=1 Tax=Bradyrhizobium guangzhouense TaxID=1325095 RepID=UPI0013E8C41B|nr:O-antigen ligase family protein [Bradyrhizobium guangzhouense]
MSDRNVSTIGRQVALWLLALAVVLSPLPLGSVGPVPAAVSVLTLSTALLCALVVPLRLAQLVVLAAALLLAMLYLFVLHEQLANQPWSVVSPYPVWSEAERLLGDTSQASLSAARNQPFFSAGLALVSFLSFATALVLSGERGSARRIFQIVAVSGAIYAVVAIVTFAIEPSRVFLVYEKQAHIGSLTSPFINRNTAAVYYGTCAAIWLSGICERIETRLPDGALSWSRLVRHFDHDARRRLVGALACWLVCLLAMFLTGSRAGAGLSLVVMVGVTAASFRRRFSRKQRLLVLGAALLGALLLLYLLGGGVGGRFSSQGLADEGRLSTYRATWRMIDDFPWFGTGLGTFEWVYPSYRTDDISMSGIWNRAHDSWLELAAGGGVLIAGGVIISLIMLGGILIAGIRTRRKDRALPVAGFAVLVLAVAHSTVDFSLQIPAYAIVTFSILGVSVGQSFRSLALRAGSRPAPPSSLRRPRDR